MHQGAKAARALYENIRQHPQLGACTLQHFCAKASLARMLQVACIGKGQEALLAD